MANKTLHSIKFPNIDNVYKIPQMAPDFDSTKSYLAGEYVVYQGVLYKFINNHSGDWDDADVEQVIITDELTELDNKVSDLKQNFTVDGVALTADQLLSDSYVEDQIPYLFRRTGGGLEVGDRAEERIVGGTVNWNQLIAKTSTLVFPAGQSMTRFMTSENYAIDFIAGHKYLTMYYQNESMASNTRNTLQYNDGTAVTQSGSSNRNLSAGWYHWLFSANSDKKNGTLLLWVHTPDIEITVDKYQVFDLTAMFGSTIADYIYNLEQATAGAGVAWFKNLFPNDYYEYNAGEMMSVSGLQSHDMVGFNIWDEEWESGSFQNSTGIPIQNTEWSRSKNFISVIPKKSYYIFIENMSTTNNAYVFFYDKDYNYVSYQAVNNRAFDLPDRCRYLKIQYKRNIEIVSNYKTCINISNTTRNGEYEPYKKNIYPLDSTLTLRGIPKLDADNKLYYDGDTYEADGTVTRKYGIVDLGTLNWINAGGYKIFYTTGIANDIRRAIADTEVFTWGRTALLTPQSYNQIGTSTSYSICVSTSGNILATLDVSTPYASVLAFKEAISGIILVYELATPTTETAKPYQHLQICDPDGTEEYVSTGIVPVGHVTKYHADLKGKLESLSDNITDVQINGTSIVTDGVANVPVASSTELGLVKEQLLYGIDITGTGQLLLITPSESELKTGYAGNRRAIMTLNQHQATFYGLAKAAGDTTQSTSSNAVGTYTDEAKTAIKSMLGVESVVTISDTDVTINGVANTRYICGEVTSISITPPSNGIIDVIFTAGTSVPVLSVPNTVKWSGNFDPTALETSTTYEINILDGVYGVVATWS